MPLQGDKQFKATWSNTTAPQAPDGAGNATVTLTGYTLTNAVANARAVHFYDADAADE